MDQPTGGPRTRPRTVLVIVLLAVVSSVGNLVIAAGSVGFVMQAVESPADPPWPGAGDPPGTTIRWSACTEDDLHDLHAQCGYLTVPLDWSDPDGTPIRLAVSRIRHTAPSSQGVMIVNPGGPGGSGVDTIGISEGLPSAVAGQYDWVGFDPRGVGDSIPALHCRESDGPQPGYSPTAEHIAAWTAWSRAYARSCARNGPILQHMTTVDSAMDVEALRKALGQRQINYYGFSYGTYLGQTYATLYPDRVRRMILDSTEDSRQVDDQYDSIQSEAFETAMRHYFAWVAEWDDVYHLGSTGQSVRDRFESVQSALAAHPSGSVGADEWGDIFLDAAYSQADWPDLTEVFVRQVRHPSRAALRQAEDDYGSGVGSGNSHAVYLAVQCSDGRVDASLPTMLAAVRAEAGRAPFATWGDAWSGMPCVFWPAPADRAIDIDGSRVSSVLMIDETLDAATPYPGSLRVRELFPGARLVAEPGGTSHAGTPDPGAPCVLNRIVRYLSTGALPPRLPGRRADATCPPPPAPVPD